MANSVTDNVESNFTTLSEVLVGLEEFAKDPSSVPPMFKDFVPDLDYADIESYVHNEQLSNPSFPAGYAIDEIHRIEATVREYYIRSFSKRDYYDNATGYFNREKDYLTQEKIQKIKYLLGQMKVHGNS